MIMDVFTGQMASHAIQCYDEGNKLIVKVPRNTQKIVDGYSKRFLKV